MTPGSESEREGWNSSWEKRKTRRDPIHASQSMLKLGAIMGTVPSKIEKLFNRLHEEAMWLQANWAIYDQLFNRSELRYKMVYECSALAAYCVQNALETEIVMSLSRLTDEPGSGDEERLSFQQFHAFLEKSTEKKLAEKLRSKIKTIRKECELIRKHRNTRLAHLNKKIAIKEDPGPDPLPIEHMEKAIKAFQEYFSAFQHHYQPDTEFTYDIPVTYAGDALISVLKHGLRLRELIDEKKLAPVERRGGKWKDVLTEKPKVSPAQ
ncbi:MAG: hypothetical protein RDU20_23035 [Desulfomonilaceae bacterium]|nr:hypothetical protein [Desulfomonilaceae bacterium]